MRTEYEKYISSPQWKARRASLIEKTFNTNLEKSNGDKNKQYECQRCHWNFMKNDLEVHHLTYKNICNEQDEDLIVVCRRCHKDLDKIRSFKSQEKSYNKLYMARLYGWASKKYGEDMLHCYDIPELAEEFDRWLEKKSYDCW